MSKRYSAFIGDVGWVPTGFDGVGVVDKEEWRGQAETFKMKQDMIDGMIQEATRRWAPLAD